MYAFPLSVCVCVCMRMTRRVFQKAGLINSEPNPDDPWDGETLSVPFQNTQSELVHVDSESGACFSSNGAPILRDTMATGKKTRSSHFTSLVLEVLLQQQWSSDTTRHHGNRQENKVVPLHPTGVRSSDTFYGQYEHTQKKKATAAELKLRIVCAVR